MVSFILGVVYKVPIFLKDVPGNECMLQKVELFPLIFLLLLFLVI